MSVKDEPTQPDERKFLYKLGIFKDNNTGIIFLALVPHFSDGRPVPNTLLRLTDTNEDTIEFYQMLKKAIEGTDKRPSYLT